MPAQTDARDEALRCAREAARVVLAKHPCVTGSDGRCCETKPGQPGVHLNCDRVLALYERQDVGREQHAAWAGDSM